MTHGSTPGAASDEDSAGTRLPEGATDPASLLLVLQHGDSFFPGGAFASSWGLETLRADGHAGDAAAVERFIDSQLRHRWAACDRPVLEAAHRAGDDLDGVAAADALVHSLSLARDQRLASLRAGRALLRVHARLGTGNAAAYLDRIAAGRAFGHVPVAQGLAWRSAGLAEGDAVIVSAHLAAVSLASAAVRLGAITHIGAQEILARARQTVTRLLRLPSPLHPGTFTPAADIAMMRHESQPTRLFAT